MILDPNDRRHYDIITAMRGPDDGNNDAKALFTAVIRGLVIDSAPYEPVERVDQFTGSRHGAVVNTMDNARAYIAHRSATAAQYGVAFPKIPVESHYYYHARWAFDALAEILPGRGIAAYWLWAREQITVK